MSSSAKSRNFRRRAGDDEDSPSTTPTPTPSTTTNKPKPKKTNSQPPPIKSLLSFADDEEYSEDSPFSRPPIKSSASSSSSRLSKSSSTSAHKLISSKDRTTPPPPLPSSNVTPQAGLYTKEALLELQKNTKTLASSSSRSKPNSEPVIVLKGLIKPVNTNNSSRDNLSVERERLRNVELRTSSNEEDEDNKVMPDQAMIDAIRAKRERLRQAKAVAPDYIAIDGGSNHGEAEGLSDEEPEFRGRIGFFASGVDSIEKTRGVFEDYENVTSSSSSSVVKKKTKEIEKSVVVVNEEVGEDDDEEDKLWEEEQVRKGLGKRLDESVVNVGVSTVVTNSGGSSVRQSQASVIYHHSPTVGNVGGELFGSDVMSIAQQAELAKKALKENITRNKESHERTLASLEKTEENLCASLLNVTALENALAAASEKFVFMQELREFVSVICSFLQHKAPFIEELEEQMQKLHEERAKAITERRTADNDDEISEIELAITAARAEFRKPGSNNAAKVAAATAAAQAASDNARPSKSAPVEIDEFGRDVNRQKRMDITRRAEARQRRRDKADRKRKIAMEKDKYNQQMEGELSTDESDSESTAYESSRDQLLQVADKIFSDASEEYSQFSFVIERFDRWKKDYASSYRDAYMSLSIPAIFSPYVRLELLKWDPLHEDADFNDMNWHSLLFKYGIDEDKNKINGDDAEADDDADANLIPELVEKLAIPILHHQLASCWDMLSTRETKHVVSAVHLVVNYVDPSCSALGDMILMLHDRLTKAVADLTVPTWSPLEMNAVSNAARIAAYRFGTSVRLMRNICLWNKILAMPVLEKIALNELLYGKVLPHLHSIQSNVHDAIMRAERVIASLSGVWAGPSVSVDRSQKLQPLVDYLLVLGKTLEKKHALGAIETETGTLVRRLKKLLVELNAYDHARAISRTFNLKEAL